MALACLRRQPRVANRGSQAIHVHRKSDEFYNRGFDLPPPLGGCMVDSQQEFRITNQTEFQNLVRALKRVLIRLQVISSKAGSAPQRQTLLRAGRDIGCGGGLPKWQSRRSR